MRTIRRPLLSAAVLSTALASLAQTPADRVPGTEAASPDPSNENPETNASGARTAGQMNARIGVGYAKTTGRSPLDDPQPRPSADDAPKEKSKRSFWDVVFGRGKPREAGREAAPPAPRGAE